MMTTKMPTPASESFANRVLLELRAADPAATRLRLRARGKAAAVGLEDRGEWIPLFRLSDPSASFNVMSLDVRHHNQWEPTGVRGIPAEVAVALLSELRFVWQIQASWTEIEAKGDDAPHSDRDHEH